jgi:hypothetical protein
MFLRNVGSYNSYMASYPRTRDFSGNIVINHTALRDSSNRGKIAKCTEEEIRKALSRGLDDGR